MLIHLVNQVIDVVVYYYPKPHFMKEILKERIPYGFRFLNSDCRLFRSQNLGKVVRASLVVLLVLAAQLGYSQTRKVSGVVISAEDNLPIPGASVIIKGSTSGTITDFDGKFSVKASKEDVLTVSFVGMLPQDVKAESTDLKVTLKPNTIEMDEVVAIGYGVAKKKELTGAVARVKAEEITRTVTSDAGAALQGLVAGVNVTASSGEPGAAAGILIRGISSIEGSNNPLYVVDGIPQEGDPRISTSEIESIDVLKDAASCAIYGSRGAAGVILITTKQGKAGTMRIGLDAVYGVKDITSGTPLMSASDQVYADIVEMRNTYDKPDDAIKLAMLRSEYYFQNETSLNDYVYEDYATTQNYNLNISGGTKELTYNVVAGYFDEGGVVVNSGFERFNTRINTVYKHNKWRITANVGFALEERERSPSGIVNQAIKYHPTNKDLDLSIDGPIYGEGNNDTENLNWVLQSFKNEDNSSTHNTNANLTLNYEIVPGLSATARGSVKAVDVTRKQFRPYQEVYDGEGTLKSDPVSTSGIKMIASQNRSMTMGLGLNYRKKFLDDHTIVVFAGQDIEHYTYQTFYGSKTNITNNDIKVINSGASDADAGSGSDYTNKLVGLIGRLQYNYKSKYLLSASMRYDGSSKFGEGKKWGDFPSVSASWVVSEEPFMQSVKQTMNTLKFRVSHGEVGNQNFKPYGYSASVYNGADYVFGGERAAGAVMTEYANKKVQWETTIQDNIGIDLAFLKNKITLTAEYYNTKKKDMLMPIAVPLSGGSLADLTYYIPKKSDVVLNVGNMTNQGLEFALGYKAKTGKVNWNFTGTFSTNDNEITDLGRVGGSAYTLLSDGGLIAGKKTTSQNNAIAVGYEAGSFFLYKTDGVIKTQEQLEEYKKLDNDAKMGDLIYLDSNGDGEINLLDRQYCGSGLPEYEAGLNVSAQYKGFDFSMQWYTAIGHEIMNGAKATAYTWNRHADMTSQWTPSNPDSDIPSYRGVDHKNVRGYTDYWVEDGTFVRLKNVTLGYTLPKNLSQKAGLTKCRLYLAAQNPLTFTNYEGFDPEVGGGLSNKGLDKGNVPVTSLYSFGVNMNF